MESLLLGLLPSQLVLWELLPLVLLAVILHDYIKILDPIYQHLSAIIQYNSFLFARRFLKMQDNSYTKMTPLFKRNTYISRERDD
jgi:hypothetical protein